MNKMKVLMAGSALGAAMLAGTAMAEVTGTVGITSEYMFRGIVSEGGSAVQGSLDWSDASGLYVGTWASNANVFPAGGNELDLYGGYKFAITEGVEVDVGAIYYLFSESDEFEGVLCGTGGILPSCDSSYAEVYAGVNVGGFSGKVYYTNSFFDEFSDDPTKAGLDGEASTYVNLAYTFPIKEGLSLRGAVGNQSGDGADNLLGDSVTDYSLTLTKELESGFAASFALVGTDQEVKVGGVTLFDDKPKFVVTLSKGFEI